MYAIVYRPNQLVEVAVATLAEVIFDFVDVITYPCWNKIEQDIYADQVIILGSYYSLDDIKCSLLNENCKLMLYDYSPDPSVGYTPEVVEELKTVVRTVHVYKEEGKGALCSFVEHVTPLLSNASSVIVKLYASLFKKLDTYSLKTHSYDVEALVTGIYASEKDQEGSKSVLTALYTGDVTVDELYKKGIVIHANNTQLAKRRALQNSKIIELWDGTKARLTVTSPELIRQTGEELLNMGDVDVAVVQRFLLSDDKPDSVAYTISTSNKNIDVTKYVVKFNGGGSPSLSGVTIELQKPFIPTHLCKE